MSIEDEIRLAYRKRTDELEQARLISLSSAERARQEAIRKTLITLDYVLSDDAIRYILNEHINRWHGQYAVACVELQQDQVQFHTQTNPAVGQDPLFRPTGIVAKLEGSGQISFPDGESALKTGPLGDRVIDLAERGIKVRLARNGGNGPVLMIDYRDLVH